jgi:hypothetical protein
LLREPLGRMAAEATPRGLAGGRSRARSDPVRVSEACHGNTHPEENQFFGWRGTDVKFHSAEGGVPVNSAHRPSAGFGQGCYG